MTVGADLADSILRKHAFKKIPKIQWERREWVS